jgi:hypothetical protein
MNYTRRRQAAAHSGHCGCAGHPAQSMVRTAEELTKTVPSLGQCQ